MAALTKVVYSSKICTQVSLYEPTLNGGGVAP